MKKRGPGQHFPHYKSMGKYFIAQGQVTLKRMIQPGPSSNWSKMFRLSCIPASYKKLWSKMKKLGPGQYFPHYIFHRSRANNSEKNDPTWLKFELVWDVIAVLITWKLQELAIKNDEARAGTTFSPLLVYGKIFYCSRASNSENNDPTWPKFELVRDVSTVLDTCKLEEVAIKSEEAKARTTFSPLYISSLKGK